MAQDPYQFRGLTDEVLDSMLDGITSIHDGADTIYAPQVIFSSCLEYQRARYVKGSYDLDDETDRGRQLIEKGILDSGFNNESQVTPVVFHLLQGTADIEAVLYQVSKKMSFLDGDFGPMHLAFMSEIVRQSRTMFGGGNAMGNLLSGNATLEYILEKSDQSKGELFDDDTMVAFFKAVRGEVAHNPWLLHDGGQIDPFDIDDVYLGIITLHRLLYELGQAIYGNNIKYIINLGPFNSDLDLIREGQDSLDWVYHEDTDGWNKTE